MHGLGRFRWCDYPSGRFAASSPGKGSRDKTLYVTACPVIMDSFRAPVVGLSVLVGVCWCFVADTPCVGGLLFTCGLFWWFMVVVLGVKRCLRHAEGVVCLQRF